MNVQDLQGDDPYPHRPCPVLSPFRSLARKTGSHPVVAHHFRPHPPDLTPVRVPRPGPFPNLHCGSHRPHDPRRTHLSVPAPPLVDPSSLLHRGGPNTGVSRENTVDLHVSVTGELEVIEAYLYMLLFGKFSTVSRRHLLGDPSGPPTCSHTRTKDVPTPYEGGRHRSWGY